MERVDVTFASPLVAFGRSWLPADDPEWSREARTAPVATVGFPRAPFGVRVGGGSTALHAGRAVLPRPHCEFRRVRLGEEGDRSDWFWAPREVLEELLGDLDERWRRECWTASVPGPALLELRRLARSRPDHDPAATEAAALEVLRAATRGFERAPEHRPTRGERRQTFDAIAWLAEHAHGPLHLDEIARAVGLTPAHLCVVFKRATGRTLSRYLVRLRLCAAVDRLAERGLSLGQLALDLGFASPSHFAARFRHEFGTTPSEARARLAAASQTGAPG